MNLLKSLLKKNKNTISENLQVSFIDKPLLHFVDENLKKHPWTLRHAIMGTQIFGATGSGKSSGSGKTIAQAFLKNGFGGIVLCAKPNERKEWEEYAKKTNRQKDLVIFSNKNNLRFDPLIYESTRITSGGGQTLNIVDLIMRIYEIGQTFMSSSGTIETERYWENALRRTVSRSIELLKIVGEDVTIENLRKIIIDSGNEQQIKDFKEYIEAIQSVNKDDTDYNLLVKAIKELAQANYCLKLIKRGKVLESSGEINTEKFYFLCSYYLTEFHSLSEKTKSTISEYYLGLIEPFLSGILKEHFVGSCDASLRPESTYLHGKIIILDFSIKEFLLSGAYIQGVYKYIWQQAMERRDIKSNNRPVFLWADESQYFINPQYDSLFQTTARSSFVCSVYLTQNINNYYFSMGSSNAIARTKSLVGNLATKIFHANSDFDTNEFAANVISKKEKIKTTLNFGERNLTKSNVSNYDFQIPPNEFIALKTGGAKKLVTAIITQTGRLFEKENFIRAKFIQD
ncbi:hypothetical protein GCM10011344_42740 [Dokdonia pacifica]|uniref:TraM recognition site of TraD and TraG n=1 Tax=Dokdonia pacifica TaxID=1627892 RepID=A0A239AJE7_9FLAO|nr:hypothetical protein [Dokdonia pacifica]GGG37363.1 hypothetical protein GCM10011344_42740 [Dokdonia pacifica]SNR95164.1 hypothetical protein SAMN06265376_104450 [Dokdonia pacifica]